MVARNLFQNHVHFDHAKKRGRQVVILKEKQRLPWQGVDLPSSSIGSSVKPLNT
jgi:hypothetical protein